MIMVLIKIFNMELKVATDNFETLKLPKNPNTRLQIL